MNVRDPVLLLPDIQSTPDERAIAIDHVGIKGLTHPLVVRSSSGAPVTTVATANMTVRLAPDSKGTHMSRFIEILQEHTEPLDLPGLRALTLRMLKRLGAEAGRIELEFPYFIRKQAPVSGVPSLLDYRVRLRAESDPKRGYECRVGVTVPVTSLCPCSKKISEYGAHNQRSHLSIDVRLAEAVGIEELVAIAEEEASCQVYGLLKRPDEKWVTERAYDNPKFVEDLVRDIALRLNRDDRVSAYVVASENFESIHNHSAYALIEHDKRSSVA